MRKMCVSSLHQFVTKWKPYKPSNSYPHPSQQCATMEHKKTELPFLFVQCLFIFLVHISPAETTYIPLPLH